LTNLNKFIALCGAILKLVAGALPCIGNGKYGFSQNYLDVVALAPSGFLYAPSLYAYTLTTINVSPLLVAALLLYPLGLIGAFASLRFRVFSFGLIAILCAAIWIYILLSYGVPIPTAPYFEAAGGLFTALSKFLTHPIRLSRGR